MPNCSLPANARQVAVTVWEIVALPVRMPADCGTGVNAALGVGVGRCVDAGFGVGTRLEAGTAQIPIATSTLQLDGV